MSLLDLLQSQDPAVNNGLLNFGLSLLRSKGNFGNAVGQAGVAGQLGARDFRQQEALMKRTGLTDQLLQMQIQQQQQKAERQAKMQALAQKYQRTPQQQAMARNGGPTVAAANAIPNMPGGFDYQGYANELPSVAGPMAALQMQALMQKDAPQPIKLGAGDLLLDPKTYKPLANNPKEEKDPETIRTLKMIYGENTPEYFSALKRLGDKTTTHQPATSVSYGAPVAGVDASGNPVFFQPDRGGGQPAIVPGVKPAPQNHDTKLPAELQRMQIAGDAMVKLMDDYEALLKKHNPRDPMTQANPTVRADMQALKRNIELQFKELQALGALAGPDIEIMRQSLSDPFTFAGAYYGKDGLLSQVKRARELVKTRSDAVLKSQGKPGDAAAPAADNDPLGLRK